jgi:hypothetical protein
LDVLNSEGYYVMFRVLRDVLARAHLRQHCETGTPVCRPSWAFALALLCSDEQGQSRGQPGVRQENLTLFRHYFDNALALRYPHRPRDQPGNRVSRRPNPVHRFRHLLELVRLWFSRQRLQRWKAGVLGDVGECEGHHNEWSTVNCPF